MTEKHEKPFEYFGLDELHRRAYVLLTSLSDDRTPDTQSDIEAIVAAFKDILSDAVQP